MDYEVEYESLEDIMSQSNIYVEIELGEQVAFLMYSVRSDIDELM